MSLSLELFSQTDFDCKAYFNSIVTRLDGDADGTRLRDHVDRLKQTSAQVNQAARSEACLARSCTLLMAQV